MPLSSASLQLRVSVFGLPDIIMPAHRGPGWLNAWIVSGAVTANRHSHGDCQHPACIMLFGHHWADVLPLQPLIWAPTTILPETACRCITGLSLDTQCPPAAPHGSLSTPPAVDLGSATRARWRDRQSWWSGRYGTNGSRQVRICMRLGPFIPFQPTHKFSARTSSGSSGAPSL